MKHTFKLLITAVAITTLSTSYAQNAATVNGKTISSAAVDFILKQQAQGGKPANPEQRKILIDRMIDMEVLAQDAAKKGLGGKDLEMELNLVKTQLLARAAAKAFQDKNAVSDADAKADYDLKIKTIVVDGKEYKARHILLDDEAQAKDIIAKLKAGGKFEELVKASKDTGSAEQGGDLGYAVPSTYTKPFGDALMAMKKGELSATPIKTEFGYHVIELNDVRDVAPPAFEEVKARIKDALMQEKLSAYQAGLRKAANVK